MAGWKHHVILHQFKIHRARWGSDPNDRLVRDASNTAQTMDRMNERFMTHLIIPGRSLPVH
ncbi:hypothetical protein [Tropicimonas isoalkanivorans]|uniref:hypothetical protein n=1 Tax=Tropicimonas isoalkanivorans TaxID=441112 RepID=UPI000B8603C2|nr:hypothetical protein [Tropicimonas isoalkanivorans]